jgi:hypothetical protein
VARLLNVDQLTISRLARAAVFRAESEVGREA